MQGGKSSSAVGAAKEAVANVGTSAWASKEKTMAVVQETVNKAKAHDPAAKVEAEARKQERIHEAEAAKRDAMRHNAAAKEHATAASYHPTTGAGVDARDVEVEGAAAPRAGSSDDGYLPVSGAGHWVGEGGGHQLPARGTPGGHSA
ncbi:11 kDa late embryogenesis abundant protein-like [Triticum dicoccoides]|uniref:11 kDa late embryogenesis abundant protein-like n=1 Tax=Triticum dicoccoides TaxID=85692 RepID=UPI000E793704|nr:11 kDa late embryogenesis abundant protein-like [Triticum dicoccoides]